MKIFIALALLSVAFATPVIQPVTLPEAPLPAMEDTPSMPVFEPIDISPLIIPQEVMEALKLAQIPAEIPAEAILVNSADVTFDTVKVVDFAELSDLAEEIPAEPVNFVDVAENIEAAALEIAEEAGAVLAEDIAEEPVAHAAEEILGEPVNFVEFAENVEADAREVVEELVADAAEDISGQAVNFVDVAENIQAADEPVAVIAEEILAEPVNFVDVAENIEVAPIDASEIAEETVAEEIPAEAVKVVDFVENIEAAPVAASDVESIAQEAVRVIDALPRYPGKVFDDPMLR